MFYKVNLVYLKLYAMSQSYTDKIFLKNDQNPQFPLSISLFRELSSHNDIVCLSLLQSLWHKHPVLFCFLELLSSLKTYILL